MQQYYHMYFNILDYYFLILEFIHLKPHTLLYYLLIYPFQKTTHLELQYFLIIIFFKLYKIKHLFYQLYIYNINIYHVSINYLVSYLKKLISLQQFYLNNLLMYYHESILLELSFFCFKATLQLFFSFHYFKNLVLYYNQH